MRSHSHLFGLAGATCATIFLAWGVKDWAEFTGLVLGIISLCSLVVAVLRKAILSLYKEAHTEALSELSALKKMANEITVDLEGHTQEDLQTFGRIEHRLDGLNLKVDQLADHAAEIRGSLDVLIRRKP